MKRKLLQVFGQIEKSIQKGTLQIMFWGQFSCHWRHGFDRVLVWRRFKRDQKSDAFLVGKKNRPNIDKTTLGRKGPIQGERLTLEWCIWMGDVTPRRGKGEGTPLPE